MTIIREHAALTDAWAATDHSHAITAASSSRASLTPMDVVRRYGVTADSPCNTYTSGKSLDSHARQYLGKRLDYVLYRQPLWCGTSAFADPNKSAVLKATETKVVFTGRVPQYEFSFSDHFGLECTFEIATPPGDIEHASPSRSGSPSPPPAPLRVPFLSSANNSAMVQHLTSAYRASRSRARRELFLFAFCLVVLLTVVVGTAWLPHTWINVLFVLFTVLVSWFATTTLYLGFIYRRWEQNALRGLIEELEILKKAADLQVGG
jgi:sphingomyelin phosphodiesterase 2